MKKLPVVQSLSQWLRRVFHWLPGWVRAPGTVGEHQTSLAPVVNNTPNYHAAHTHRQHQWSDVFLPKLVSSWWQHVHETVSISILVWSHPLSTVTSEDNCSRLINFTHLMMEVKEGDNCYLGLDFSTQQVVICRNCFCLIKY